MTSLDPAWDDPAFTLEKLPGHKEPVRADVPDARLHFLLLFAKTPIRGIEGKHWISSRKGSESLSGLSGLPPGWEAVLALPTRNRTSRNEAILLFTGEVPRGVPSSQPCMY